MNKISIVAVAAGLALGLVACSVPPSSGTVYQRPYEPPGYWYSTECDVYMPVVRTRTSTVYNAKGQASGVRTETYTEMTCALYKQVAHQTPPSWSLCLVADDDPKHKGCFEVPENTWQRYEVGSHYPDPR